MGLKINEDRTKEMKINSKNRQNIITIGIIITQVDQFQYLSSWLQKQVGLMREQTGFLKQMFNLYFFVDAQHE